MRDHGRARGAPSAPSLRRAHARHVRWLRASSAESSSLAASPPSPPNGPERLWPLPPVPTFGRAEGTSTLCVNAPLRAVPPPHYSGEVRQHSPPWIALIYTWLLICPSLPSQLWAGSRACTLAPSGRPSDSGFSLPVFRRRGESRRVAQGSRRAATGAWDWDEG